MTAKKNSLIILLAFISFTVAVSIAFLGRDYLNLKRDFISNQLNQVQNLLLEHSADISKGKLSGFSSSISKFLYKKNISTANISYALHDEIYKIEPILTNSANKRSLRKCQPYKYASSLDLINKNCFEQSVTDFYDKESVPLITVSWNTTIKKDAFTLNTIVKRSLYFIVVGILISIFIYYRLQKSIILPMEIISKNISNNPNKLSEIPKLPAVKSAPSEILFLVNKIINLYREVEELNENKVRSIKQEERIKLAEQVAHDIRSPLAALNMILTNPDVNEEGRSRILKNSTERINDIANELLFKFKKKAPASSEGYFLISEISSNIIFEKKIEFKNNKNLHLSFSSNLKNNIFVNLDKVTIQRVISNLINNSAEAITYKGNIEIKLYAEKEFVILEVVDDGHGISPKILDQVIKKGFSSGKENGSGLGLYHAFESAKSWGGKLEISSVEGSGTKVILFIPISENPSWFPSKIQLTLNQKILILDDDNSIHALWDQRFKMDKYKKLNLNIQHAYNSDEVFKILNEENFTPDDIFLFDYDLSNNEENGFDILKEIEVSSNKYLVTSHYEDIDLQSKCEDLSFNLLPKSLASSIDIQIQNNMQTILLDDDEMMIRIWAMQAKKSKTVLKTYSSETDLLKDLDFIDKNTVFYIDSNLSNNVKGENIAKQLHDLGYLNLYLTTGYEKDKFNHLNFLKGVIGKDPPF